MANPAIRTRNLRKSYGDVQALSDLSLTVERGEFFGLLGPNGAGKTTFINTLVGLVHSDAGSASVFGYDVGAEYREARDRIGLAPQEYNVDRFFPIQEVLEHKAGYHGVARSVATERAEKALQTVGIWDKRDTRFDWLSGGMKRRFMLARALVSDPDLLILDEPTAGVDVQLRHDLWKIINRMNDAGTTILLTTHYIEEAERLCDRVAILDQGRKIEVATPDELMARGTDTIELALATAPEVTPSIDVEGVQRVSREGDRLSVVAAGASRLAPEIMRTLEADGHTVTSIDVRRASLEEVFVDLTREERDQGLASDDDPERASDDGSERASDDGSERASEEGER